MDSSHFISTRIWKFIILWTHFISTTQITQQTLTRVLEICYPVDSPHLNYSTRSTNLDSGFGDLLSGGLNSFNTPRLGFWEFTIDSNDTIMDNNRYVKYFLYFFLVNLTQNLKVSYRFWKIKIFCFIDSTI